MKIPISETFLSIQGEGKYTGAVSYFIRTSGCNLRCWFCDTPYTSWKPDGTGTEVSELIKLGLTCNARHIVLTGGEPMLFSEAMIEMCDTFRRNGRTVTIETNGTIFDSAVQPDLWSVSPKLASSTPNVKHLHEQELHQKNLHPEAIPFFLQAARGNDAGDVQYKFVVEKEPDIAEVLRICSDYDLPNDKVWLMPQGRTPEEVTKSALWAVEHCKKLGFHLSMRVHTILWGAKRGV